MSTSKETTYSEQVKRLVSDFESKLVELNEAYGLGNLRYHVTYLFEGQSITSTVFYDWEQAAERFKTELLAYINGRFKDWQVNNLIDFVDDVKLANEAVLVSYNTEMDAWDLGEIFLEAMKYDKIEFLSEDRDYQLELHAEVI